MKKMVLGKFPRGYSHPKNSNSSNSPLETNPSPRKIATQKILACNIPTHFVNCLSTISFYKRKDLALSKQSCKTVF